MAVNTKRVFYVKYLSDQKFADLLGARPDVTLEKLENDSPAAQVEPVLAAAHAYQVGASRDELAPQYHVHDALLARTPNLLVVSSNGAGYDTIDLEACTRAGVLAVNQAGGNREAVAEHVLGMLLCLTKRIGETDRVMRRPAAGGAELDRNAYMGRDAMGKTIGIIGLGHVGTRVAELCRLLFGMRVLAYDPYLTAEQVAARGAEASGLDDLLRRADFVSLNCPRTKETLGLIGAREYTLMQPHAYFITTARGGIHDEAALAEALRGRRIAGAGLDVWGREPPPADHPLMAFDNVLVSPHTAGVTHEARVNMATIAAEQMLAILDGKPAVRLLNPDAWPAFAARFERILGFAPRRD
ncbi:MAG: 3-phosphoglycerate dehydrogenase [Rhodospirillales bacterium 70-18]|nr:hydroxyacid dehydrogenase [Rhodospirillales bacterium]OJY65818.1 MAG: 3-phosphoglycerate dehydrogenase [Rhodospirillales bacterium 70-18]